MISLHVVEGSGWSMAWKRSGPVWLVAGLVLVTALAVLDLALGSDVALIGLLVAGSLVASMSAQPRGTAWVSLYGFALAIGLGAPNDAWATAEHAARCAGVFAGGGLSVWLAWLGLDRERRITRLAVQRAIAQALSETTTLAQAGPLILRTLGEMLDWATAAIWRVEREEVLRRVAGWHAPGLAVDEFERLSRDVTFMRGVGLVESVEVV